jgi:hypothetical protein
MVTTMVRLLPGKGERGCCQKTPLMAEILQRATAALHQTKQKKQTSLELQMLQHHCPLLLLLLLSLLHSPTTGTVPSLCSLLPSLPHQTMPSPSSDRR